jgi:hypothetical protein
MQLQSRRTALAVAFLAALSGRAAAQAINVDLGFGPPSATYGAASGQTGVWNSAPVQAGPISLVDVQGAATAVTLSGTESHILLTIDNPATTGDDDALMDDFLDGQATLTFTGLKNGKYDVYTYAWAPDDPSYMTQVSVPGGGPMQVVGGLWNGHGLGTTYAKHKVTVSGGSITVFISPSLFFATTNGIQIVPEPPPACPAAVVYCTSKPGLSCGPTTIASTGAPSASKTFGFTIHAAPARTSKTGMLLYTNTGRATIPFPAGGHILCIGNQPLKRAGPVTSGGAPGTTCGGQFSLDMNAFATGNFNPGWPTATPAPFLLQIGTQINCQWWGRDSAAVGSYMSNGLEYIVCP